MEDKGCLWILVIFVGFLMILGLTTTINNYGAQLESNEGDAIHIMVIDSCEYIYMTKGYRGYMAHKGNCKFCLERQRKLMEE